jgi:hypothetical protein
MIVFIIFDILSIKMLLTILYKIVLYFFISQYSYSIINIIIRNLKIALYKKQKRKITDQKSYTFFFLMYIVFSNF